MQTLGLNGREIEKKKKANNKDSRLNLFCGIYPFVYKAPFTRDWDENRKF
jgi:hypothetical protein